MKYKKLSTSAIMKICEEVENGIIPARDVAKKHGVPNRSLSGWLKKFRQGVYKKTKIDKSQINCIEQENELLKREVGVLKEIKSLKEEKIIIKATKTKDERTAFVLISDWHIEERV